MILMIFKQDVLICVLSYMNLCLCYSEGIRTSMRYMFHDLQLAFRVAF